MTIETPETIEGTWDEIAQLAPKLNGHRLRVTILPPAPPDLRNAPTGRYAARMKAELANLPPATPEEVAAAEAEIEELRHNLNENRRREGAEPIF